MVFFFRASDTIKMYQDDCVPVTHDTIEGAIKWLWDLDRLAGVSKTACVEAVLRACEDKQVSYYFCLCLDGFLVLHALDFSY